MTPRLHSYTRGKYKSNISVLEKNVCGGVSEIDCLFCVRASASVALDSRQSDRVRFSFIADSWQIIELAYFNRVGPHI